MSELTVRFEGAAGTVTGSRFLLQTKKTQVLIDCGLFQGLKELRLRNWDEPAFNPAELSAVVLTHAHLDHTGYLPVLVRKGFRGTIFCTPATADLLSLLLPDSAYLQEEEAKYANEHGTSKHKPAKPLYNQRDAQETLKLLRPITRGNTTEVANGFSVTPSCAGHILGSASLTIDVLGKRINISGDIGRYNSPVLPDPEPIELGDLLLCESTYGDRFHPDADTKEELRRVILRTVEKKGVLLVPAFAIGRTQTLLYYLSQLEEEGKIPVLPVYVDSPMAVDATKIYSKHRGEYDDESVGILSEGRSPFKTSLLNFCRSVEESKRLNGLTKSRIIIAASGMVTGGRILHHMSQLLPRPECTVLFVGYQAEQTRGNLLQSGAKELKIFGRMVPVNAKIETISSLSAHGDQNELLRWLQSCKGKPKKVKVVHGEPNAAHVFSNLLREKLGWDASPAANGEVVMV